MSSQSRIGTRRPQRISNSQAYIRSALNASNTIGFDFLITQIKFSFHNVLESI